MTEPLIGPRPEVLNVRMMLKRSHGEMRTGADGSDGFSETFHSS